MLLDPEELERLKNTPFWERVTEPRLALYGLLSVALGGGILYWNATNAGWEFLLFHLIPISFWTIGWLVIGLGALAILFWVVGSLKARLTRGY